MKIFLIGLNHSFQLKGYEKGWKFFKTYLYEQCIEENPDLIAEELNIEAIELWKASDSVARIVANSLGIDHLFCDPDSNQRKKHGIKSRKEIIADLGFGRAIPSQESEKIDRIEKKQWPKREEFWLKRLLGHGFKKCIFLVGTEHIDSFSEKIKANSINLKIITQNWEP